MKTVFFFIIESKGTWWATNGGRQLGPYETSQLALDAIVWAVTNFPDPDAVVSAVGRDADGKTRMLWRQEARDSDIEADSSTPLVSGAPGAIHQRLPSVL